jgi:hypothetical protein
MEASPVASSGYGFAIEESKDFHVLHFVFGAAFASSYAALTVISYRTESCVVAQRAPAWLTM